MFRDINKMLKSKLIEHCKLLGVEYVGKKKEELKEAIRKHELEEIKSAIAAGNDAELLKEKIEKLVVHYTFDLKEKIATRMGELEQDGNSHYFAYQILGVSDKTGKKIDKYQNKGRLLYNAAGRFMEEAASLCLLFANREGIKSKVIKYTQDGKEKTFEVDFLNGTDAIEIKWRDATTDGDHKKKEEKRIEEIKNSGCRPIRIMFFCPERKQAKKIQKKLRELYRKLGGEYYAGNEAWKYLFDTTGYDLKGILTKIVEQKKRKRSER